MECYRDIAMSVINQMLKDLDQRQSEQKGTANAAVSVTTKISARSMLLVIVAILVLNVLGIFSWQLYSENQQLKDQVLAVEAKSDANTTQPIVAHSNEKNTDEKNINPPPIIRSEPVREKALATTSIAKKEAMDKADNVAKQLSALSEKPVMLNSDSPAVSKLKAINQPESVVDLAQKKPVLDIVKLEDTDTKPSLTISRTQLTPQALAANKITEAEQAIERNDIIKAEALFEEVLLIMPEHETARKQLAALWYGKKSYQDAVNLLSQGIALAPQSEEMRLMTARIYYEQGQPRPAYNVLSPVKHSTSTELQALLANTAADLSEHDNAIIAYQKLIALEPHIGRWWLGSAVSLDSLGKFVPARDAYKQAIARNNLSNSAMQFARQRLIELGE